MDTHDLISDAAEGAAETAAAVVKAGLSVAGPLLVAGIVAIGLGKIIEGFDD